jgi:hypothetical protein
MTAPAAPTIRAHCDGFKVRVFWQPVDGATDYNVYYADESQAAAVEAQLDSVIDLGSDGWFHYTFRPDGSIVQVYVTALNALVEESVASNVKGITLT